MTLPTGAVSTKCEDSFGSEIAEPSTICTVYAGPQRRVSPAAAACGAGESMWMSAMCPPCGTPNLMSASEISQVENLERALLFGVAVDIARKIGCSLVSACFMGGSREYRSAST